jgi:hypothetical protein
VNIALTSARLGVVARRLRRAADHGYTEPYKIITVSPPGQRHRRTAGEGRRRRESRGPAKSTTFVSPPLQIARASHLAATRNDRVSSWPAEQSHAREPNARTEMAIKDAQVAALPQIENRTMQPVDGIVTEIKRDASEAVSPTQPQVLTVVQIDKLS